MSNVDLGADPDTICWNEHPDGKSFQSQAQYPPAGPLTPSGAHDLVARHANHVVFEFEHFAVPESLLLVSECLTRIEECAQRKGSDAADWLRAFLAVICPQQRPSSSSSRRRRRGDPMAVLQWVPQQMR